MGKPQDDESDESFPDRHSEWTLPIIDGKPISTRSVCHQSPSVTTPPDITDTQSHNTSPFPFMQMPVELRLRIWNLAFQPQKPRFHAFVLHKAARFTDDAPDACPDKALLRRSTAMARSLLAVCVESRIVVQEAFPDVFNFDDGRSRVHFSATRDFLSLKVYGPSLGVESGEEEYGDDDRAEYVNQSERERARARWSQNFRTGRLITGWGRMGCPYKVAPSITGKARQPREEFLVVLQDGGSDPINPACRMWNVSRDNAIWAMPGGRFGYS